MVNEALLVGVDVGGSKTHIRGTRAGTVILDETCASDGWDLTSRPASALWLARLLVTLLPMPSARPVHIVAGAHGSETPAHCEELASELQRHLSRPVAVVNDAELVVPAVGESAGVGVIAGTGSIVVGRHSRTGQYMSAGGWGWVLGDEGSASALVREAVRALLRAADLRPDDHPVPTDRAQDALLSSFHVPDLATLAAVMSSSDGVRTWGAHAPAVFTAASQGSTVLAAFAPKSSMRIYDRGIRRRLAPMMKGDRRHIELAYSLQFAMPGTPVFRYGEEIGMGENLALPGREAIRTPMQWEPGRSAGFSTAAPDALVRPLTGGGLVRIGHDQRP